MKLVHTTVEDRTQAERLSHQLIADGLATCVQMLPISSIYCWQGKIEHDDEVLLQIKTTDARVDATTAALERLHPHEVPEVVTIAIERVSAPYAAWAETQTEAGEQHA